MLFVILNSLVFLVPSVIHRCAGLILNGNNSDKVWFGVPICTFLNRLNLCVRMAKLHGVIRAELPIH